MRLATAPTTDRVRARGRRLDRGALLVAMAMGALGALGGARPTGVGWLDAVLLGLGGVAAAACGARARTIPVYVAAGAAALFQPATAPLVLACAGLVAAFAHRYRRRDLVFGALAGGLAWAGTVGAPFEPGATTVAVPLLALGWVVLSARRHGGRRFRRRVDRLAIGVAGLAVVATGLGAMAAVNARAHIDRGADLVEAGLAAARAGDTDAAVDQLRGGRRALARGESSLGAVWARPAWLVPGVSQNARALHTVVAEVGDLAGVAITTAEDADLASLRARSGQIDLAAVREVQEPLADVLAALRTTKTRLDDLAGQALAGPVATRLDEVRAEIDDAIPSAELALQGAEVAPGLLGGDGPRTYLVLFTTPTEARARSGFPGNFAEITFTDGRFELGRFGRIGELDPPPGEDPPVASVSDEHRARYARFEADRNWRNITLSPDFPTVAAVATELYPRSGGRPVDGVLSVDPVALAALLRFTGPIAVPGVATPLDADNAAPFLLRDQYIELPDTPDRVDVLEQLAELTFRRLTTVDLPEPAELADILGPVAEQGHLQLATPDAAELAFLDRAGLSGRFPEVEGDFLAVTTSNAAMSKIDVFLRRQLAYEAHWDPSTGALTATATITLTNEAPASGLPRYLIGNNVGENRPGGQDMPDGWNNTFLTLYTPWWPEGATIDGQPLSLEVLPELGRLAISTVVALGPGETRTIEIELAGQLAGPGYVLDLAAQPLVEPEQATVDVRVAGTTHPAVTGPVTVRGGGAHGAWPLVGTTRITAERP